MKIHILHEKPTLEQVSEMMEEMQTYIKLAGGSEWHADCEKILLDDGSSQENVWGADWYPDKQLVGFESFINIRPRQHNKSSLIQNAELRARIEKIVRSIFE
jgi:hypothetical protein